MDSTPPPLPHEQALAIRKDYLSHERALRSVSLLYRLPAIQAVMLIVIMGLSNRAVTPDPKDQKLVIVFAVCFTLLAVGMWVVSNWITAYRKKAILPVSIVSGLGLLAFPLGTLINAYILHLFHSRKGKYIFSSEYAEVIRMTPEIAPKTSMIVKVLVGILILLAFLGVLGAVLVPSQTP